MAGAATQDPKVAQEIPTAFPPGTLFVAVNDGIQQYAGEDGGPQHGGRGRWRTGDVAAWTSSRPVPVAHRDPETGLIWKGWLEPVVRTYRGERGQIICEESQHFYSQPMAQEQRAAENAKKRGMMVPKAKKPTSKAARRATLGAPEATDALKPITAQRQAAAAQGIPLDDRDDRVLDRTS